MLVVDQTVFAQLRATHTGIDFMEISSNLIRAQRIQPGAINNRRNVIRNPNGIIHKGLSSEFLPPAYEEIYGRGSGDLPPAYSEISIVNEKAYYKAGRNLKGPFRIILNNNTDSVNDVRTHSTLRAFPSAPSIPNELKAKRRLLLTIKKKHSSLDAINMNSITQNSISSGTITSECVRHQNMHESIV